jgi:hypothetical protein
MIEHKLENGLIGTLTEEENMKLFETFHDEKVKQGSQLVTKAKQQH